MDITPEVVVLERVRAAGGRLRLADLDEAEFAAWRRASKVVQLRLLRVGHERLSRSCVAGRVDLWLTRTDLPDPPAPQEQWSPPAPVFPKTAEFVGRHVPVPAKVSEPHPLLERLETALDWPEQSMRRRNEWSPPSPRRPMQRMRRIWQAIISEAVFRGYAVSFAHNRRDVYDRGRLVVEIGRDEFPLELYGDLRVPLRLRVTVQHPHRRRGYDTWTDRERQPLQAQLGEVFTHIERWAELLVAKREKERREAIEQRRRRDRAEVEARRQFTEDHRHTVLIRRLDSVRDAEDARVFAVALQVAADGLEPERAEQVRAWADWALEYAERTDPRVTLAGAPARPTPTRRDLEPYLKENGFYY